MSGAKSQRPEEQGMYTGAPTSEWDFCSIASVSSALRSRRISALELLEHVIARIEALDLRLNAVVVPGPARSKRRLKCEREF
jgi:amidase